MPNILATAMAITQAASAIPMSYFRKTLALEAKSDTSPVTIADRETEQFIRAELMRAFPDDGILGEEFGVIRAEAEAIWVVDPIDGTRSFITGSPMFGMLLGRVVAGRPEIGIVRMPALNETFAGAPGRGATLNGRPIACRKTKRLALSLIHISEPTRPY